MISYNNLGDINFIDTITDNRISVYLEYIKSSTLFISLL